MRTHTHYRRRAKQGFSLIQTMVAMATSLFVAYTLAQITLTTSRIGGALTTRATLQQQGRRSIEQMVQDLQSGNAIMASYTARNGTTYRTNTTDTLVLRAPSYDASGVILSGKNDFIVYKLTPMTAGRNGAPYKLTCLVENDASGQSARWAHAEKTIANNVKSANFKYLYRYVTRGNGINLTFGLDTAILGLNSSAVESLTVGGAPFAIGSDTQVKLLDPILGLPLGALVFLQPPLPDAVIELLYAIDPSLAPSQDKISQVSVNLKLEATDPSGTSNNKVQTVDLSSSAVLRNR
jgi:hypothetical protein